MGTNLNKVKLSSRKEYEYRIHKVLDFIEQNITLKLTLTKLSNESYFSPFHFHRIFHAFTGETPVEYINRVRLEKAANFLILNLDESITEIAYKCGFNTSAAFARSFKEFFGLSATGWRKGGYINFSKALKTNSKIWKDNPFNKFYFDGSSKNKFKNLLMKTEIKNMPGFHVSYIAHFEGYNSKIGKLFEKLCNWAGPKGILNPETKFIGISLDNPRITPPEKCRYYACIAVPQNVKPDKTVNVTEIPSGKCLVARFEGSEKDIALAYDELFYKHLPESGWLPQDRPAYEIYYLDPNKDPKGKFKMDICIPLKPLKGVK